MKWDYLILRLIWSYQGRLNPVYLAMGGTITACPPNNWLKKLVRML